MTIFKGSFSSVYDICDSFEIEQSEISEYSEPCAFSFAKLALKGLKYLESLSNE